MKPKEKKSYYIIIALVVIGFLNIILLSGKRNFDGLIPEFLNLPSDHPLVIGASIASIVISIALIAALVASGNLRRRDK